MSDQQAMGVVLGTIGLIVVFVLGTAIWAAWWSLAHKDDAA